MAKPLNAYQRAMEQIEQELTAMGERVKEQLNLALKALLEQNTAVARGVVAGDVGVDAMDGRLQYQSLELISLQQPTTQDLRTLAGILRVSRELERIGDYAVNVAEAAIYLAGTGEYFKPLEDIPRMCRAVAAMVEDSLTAYTRRDLNLARSVLGRDDGIDGLFKDLHDELIDYMKRGSRYVEQGSYFLLIARYLERVGDHAVNIAQATGFLLTGERLSERSPGR